MLIARDLLLSQHAKCILKGILDKKNKLDIYLERFVYLAVSVEKTIK